MKYSNEILIRLPLEKVIKLFDSEENMFKWQPELISFEHLSGEKGEVGSKARLLYKMGNREVEMIETILVKDLPDEFSGTYEAKGVWNKVSNHFEKVDDHTTKWRSDCIFEFSGFMKLIALIMPGSFNKQSRKFMEQFKSFAEEQKQ